jgi:hypothetical protein
MLAQTNTPHIYIFHMQRVWYGTFLGLPAVVKQRFKKMYRHPTLDATLTERRLKQARPAAGILQMLCFHAFSSCLQYADP